MAYAGAHGVAGCGPWAVAGSWSLAAAGSPAGLVRQTLGRARGAELVPAAAEAKATAPPGPGDGAVGRETLLAKEKTAVFKILAKTRLEPHRTCAVTSAGCRSVRSDVCKRRARQAGRLPLNPLSWWRPGTPTPHSLGSSPGVTASPVADLALPISAPSVILLPCSPKAESVYNEQVSCSTF